MQNKVNLYGASEIDELPTPKAALAGSTAEEAMRS